MNILKGIFSAIGVVLIVMLVVALWYVALILAVVACAIFIGYMIYQYSTKSEDEIFPD